MQKDSVHFSTSGNLTHGQAAAQESPIKSLRCCHCSFLLKSKVYLFEHLNEAHGMDVDAALREAGLKSPGTDKTNTDNNSSGSGNHFECQHGDFQACSRDILNEHEKQCQNKTENQNLKGNVISSGNLENKTHSTDQHKEAAGAKEISSALSVMSTSKAKCTLNSSKDLKTYKRTLQTITTYFAASSGSNKTSPVKSADSPVHLNSTKGTLILQESPSDSNPNSSGVFKVTAKPMIDISKPFSNRFLLDDHLVVSDLRSAKVKEQIKEAVSNNTGKSPNNESLKHLPAKKAKANKEETEKERENANTNKEQTSSTEYSFEFSEDEEENKDTLVNGETESPNVYFCKHCDYSDVSISRVSIHYQNDHPYVRYNAVYIQDRSDQSATFRCLECPVEFIGVGQLKKHYTENHPGAPNVFKMQSHELNLVYKCFVCPFIASALRTLRGHYKQIHPTHAMDNSLMYCRYSVTSCQERPSLLNACEKVPSPVRPQSPKSPCAPCKEVKNAPSPQHPTSKGEHVTLYHCNKCKFNHKSAVVMHVHYQKCHPKEAVTIDKIKQSARVTSHTTSQVTPDEPPNSVTKIEESIPQKNISELSMETRNKSGLSQQNKASLSLRNSQNTPEASKTHLESTKTKKVESAEDTSKGEKLAVKRKRETSAEKDSVPCTSPNKLFYCQFCCYSSTNIKSVVGHHNAKHSGLAPTDIEGILCYSAKVQKKKLKSKAEARTSSSNSKTPKQGEMCGEEPQHKEDVAADVSVMEVNPYAHAENLFYCPKCNYGNPFALGVLCHQAKVHQGNKSSKEIIIEYTALIRDEIKKSKAQAKESHSSTHLPLPLMLEGDEVAFFCHFCNYRHGAMQEVLRHYLKSHRNFMVKSEEVRQYTCTLLKWAQTSHARTTADREVNPESPAIKGNKRKKTKDLDKVSASPLRTQRILQCHRCQYKTEYVNVLRRHMWKSHKANRSVMQVLRVCFQQGALQTGYHCDVCVFSHKKAEVVYKHYQKQHPGRIPSLEYVTTRLYVSPETCSPKKRQKKPQIKRPDATGDSDGTDSSLPSQRSGQNETKVYSCRACSFKGRSVAIITNHYRAVHPWSVKEDGSVLDVINSKRQSGRQVEDHNEIPVSFDSYQVPLEFDNSPGSPHEATVSSTEFKCPFCSSLFTSQHGLRVHCGMKHLNESLPEDLYEEQAEQVQTKTRLHVFKCPHCTYMNTNYHGVLTHCHMMHPALESTVASLYVDETRLHNLEDYLKRDGDDLRLSGYMCKTCPQIYATLKKLNKHCKKDHNETAANMATKKPNSAHKPSAVIQKKLSKSHSHQVSVSKVSFLSKKKLPVFQCQQCPYGCTTKLGLSRHVHFRHKSAVAQDSLYKCALCSSSYSMKKHLGSHYKNKHGREAFLKYYAPYKRLLKMPAPTVLDVTSTQQPENASEACISSMTAEKNKIFVYKCPNCPYVNASHHGVLTHCQMQHPDVIARADELETDEILVSNMVKCKLGKGSNERGYMCKKCPQIHVSLKELKIHCEKDHSQAKATDSELSAETETKKQPDLDSESSVVADGASENKTSAVKATEMVLGHQLEAPETCQSSTPSAQKEESQYKCHACTYIGSCRKYLYTHYRNTHKFDQFTTHKLLAKYNKRNRSIHLLEAESEESTHVKCKICPDITFDSSQLLIAHYSVFHSSDSILDFTVLTQASKKTTGLYKCSICEKQIDGIKKLCCHLDSHWEKKTTKAAKTSPVITTTPEAKSIKVCGQDELPILETVDELAQWYAKPVETFTLPTSPLSSPSQPTDVEQPELESRQDDKHTCKQCRRSFNSLKGLRSHERSHAALAAIKKLDVPSTSTFKHNINKYILYKAGTVRPFLCSFCNYRTTVMGLWRSHFMRKHQEVFMGPAQTDDETDERAQRADEEPPNSSEELNNLAELDEDPDVTERSLYLEPPDVQRQLAHYSLMAQGGDTSKANVQEALLPDSVLHCELCNFNTEHLSSMRRHYLNRHGKKILRCKDCDFFTSLRKTLEMHMEMGHSTCQSGPTHQKDLHCPFCLYQTKNKNNMIDHIVLHREERVVPIEVRRPKLSRYLQGIVFRCHKCTFTSSSAENLRLHMTRHDDIKPYKCRLCYFDCTQLNDLEAHLSDKHQVLRNHELVGQISLDQLEARTGTMPEGEEEPLSNSEHHDNDSEDVKTEEFDTDCNEVPHETQAENLADNNIREDNTLQIKEYYQQQGQNGNDEIPAKSSVSDLQYGNTKSNPTVQERHERDPQEQAEIELLPDTERGQRIENTAEQMGNNLEIQHEDISCPEKERQTNENRSEPKHRHSDDSSVTLTQHKEEAAEGSSTYCKRAKRAQPLKLQMKALKQRALNIEASIEDDILRHILLLDEDGSIHKIHKKTGDRTVKTEQDIGPEAVDNTLLLDKEGSIASAHNRKNQVNTEPISSTTKINHRQGNVRAQERFTVERHLLSLAPNCGQFKISSKEILGVSFTNCKEKQVQNQKNSEEVRDSYREMPVLEHECLKEETDPLDCFKEEDVSDHLEQKQDTEDEIIAGDENQSTCQEHQESDGRMDTENPHVPKGGLTDPVEAPAEEKRFSCELCGRNLKNSSELERHITRHRI